MDTKIPRILISLLLVLAMAFAVVTPALAEAPASENPTTNYEIKFMQGMVDHHMMAVMEAEICLQNATHAELSQMCSDIIATQTMEMMMMQTWLLDWYGISYEPHMTPGMMHQLEKLAALEGAEFEIVFMESMIMHHQGAIKDGEKCLEKADHAELLSLCMNIITTQAQEIQVMQTWLCDWYGLCKM